jgi:signal transduction histidine kinase
MVQIQGALIPSSGSFGPELLSVEDSASCFASAQKSSSSHGVAEQIRIKIDDDCIGFGESSSPPRTIASHMAEFGGKLVIRSDAPGGHLEIALPTG